MRSDKSGGWSDAVGAGMPILEVIPDPWPGVTCAKARIVADNGRSYSCHCSRDLTFTVWQEDQLVVAGKTGTGRGRECIELIGPAGALGTIRPGRGLSLSDRLLLDGVIYKLPTILHPDLPTLGMKFSRLGLLGLRTHSVAVVKDSSVTIALAILGYLTARSIFVEG